MNYVNYIAVIPARKGSKRLKNKNLKKIKKIKLFDYTLNAALNTKKIKKIIVTTNIKDLIKKNNKRLIYIKRPEYLCKDTSSTETAILHLLKKLKTDFKIIPKNIILLQPTSPFRETYDIVNAIKIYEKGNYNSLLSVYKSKFFLWKEYRNKKIKPFNYKIKKRIRSQKLKPFLVENGAIFIFKYKNFIKYKNRLIEPIGYSVMNKKNSVEIDNNEDYIYANSFK